MATDSYWQLEREYYTISPTHDLIIRAIEYEIVIREERIGDEVRNVKASVPKKVHEFKVERNVLVKSSPYFEKILSAETGFKEDRQDIQTLHEDPAGSVELWLKILHASDVEPTYESTSILGIWEMLATAHKYGLDPKMPAAKVWFEMWFNKNKDKVEGNFFDYQDYQALLFPCHTFDFPAGFQRTTKFLAYHAAGHITEKRPDGFYHEHLRLDANVIQHLNAAKGRLKTILHRGLYDPIDELLKHAHCDCKEKTLYTYELALSKTGAWPLESAFIRYSVKTILEKLDGFPGGVKIPKMCIHCIIEFEPVVSKAVEDTDDYFDGLCLDCMEASKPKLGDADQDYWKHTDLGVPWDKGCRIKHGQPTWYFSFLGRRQKMIEWTQEKRNTFHRRFNYR